VFAALLVKNHSAAVPESWRHALTQNDLYTFFQRLACILNEGLEVRPTLMIRISAGQQVETEWVWDLAGGRDQDMEYATRDSSQKHRLFENHFLSDRPGFLKTSTVGRSVLNCVVKHCRGFASFGIVHTLSQFIQLPKFSLWQSHFHMALGSSELRKIKPAI
jgi:hypothetical protein